MLDDRTVTRTTVVRPGLLPYFQGVVGLFAALVLLQALLVGRGIFLDRDLITVHGRIGDLTALVALIQAVLAFFVVGLRGPSFLISVLLFVLGFIQLSLGYAIADSAGAGAWHVPNGVLIFGIATAHLLYVMRLRR